MDTNLKYADETALIAQSEETLQHILETVVEASESKELALNISKTESMTKSKNPNVPTCKSYGHGVPVK